MAFAFAVGCSVCDFALAAGFAFAVGGTADDDAADDDAFAVAFAAFSSAFASAFNAAFIAFSSAFASAFIALSSAFALAFAAFSSAFAFAFTASSFVCSFRCQCGSCCFFLGRFRLCFCFWWCFTGLFTAASFLA